MTERFFIAPTPRTGNTWLRKLLADSLGLTEFVSHSIEEIPWSTLPERCVAAVHVHASEELHARLAANHFRIIVTMRHPLDVLISILQFSKHDASPVLWLGGEAGDEASLASASPLDAAFLDYACGARARALLGLSLEWLPYAAACVRYESLARRPAACLKKTLRTLRVRSMKPLSDVVENNSLENLRIANPGQRRHFWRGEPNVWRRLLPRENVVRICQCHHVIFERLGYRCNYDPRLTPERAAANWLGLYDPQALGPAWQPKPLWSLLWGRRR